MSQSKTKLKFVDNGDYHPKHSMNWTVGWTVFSDEAGKLHSREEWLVLRRDLNGRAFAALSNAPADAPLLVLARRQRQRFFIERTTQDAKFGFGWDEVQTTKYIALEHHLALTILAAWFIAETKLDWAVQFARDPTYWRAMNSKCSPISGSPTSAPCSGPPSHSRSYRLGKPLSWSSSISSIALVPASRVSKIVLALNADRGRRY